MIKHLVIIGVGLIGGSIARAARKRGLVDAITGIDPNPDNLHKAQQLGVIDQAATSASDLSEPADIVIIASPVGCYESIFSNLKAHWCKQTVYSDTGSTKSNIIDAACQVFGQLPDNFVPAHPIAGAESSGVEAAKPDLYQNKRVILTPQPNTDTHAVTTISTFWQSLGAHITKMDAAHHDKVLAATSHLPHILAYALVEMLGQLDEQEEIFQYAAGGFKDFTRIASSDPTMWRDICLANQQQLIPLIHAFREQLDTIATLMQNDAEEDLTHTFRSAKKARQRFLDQYDQ